MEWHGELWKLSQFTSTQPTKEAIRVANDPSRSHELVPIPTTSRSESGQGMFIHQLVSRGNQLDPDFSDLPASRAAQNLMGCTSLSLVWSKRPLYSDGRELAQTPCFWVGRCGCGRLEYCKSSEWCSPSSWINRPLLSRASVFSARMYIPMFSPGVELLLQMFYLMFFFFFGRIPSMVVHLVPGTSLIW